jgi:intron-binding protein aquarius
MISKRNIDPRHLLRLGSGEMELRASLAKCGALGSGRGQGEQFSKQGRVNWSLMRRLRLLEQVQKLAISLQIGGDVGYTCETAEFFYQDRIRKIIEKYEEGFDNFSIEDVEKEFPFKSFFSDAPEPLFGDGKWMLIYDLYTLL